MTKYNLLILLGWIALAVGILLQVKASGTIYGDALIPLLLIYAAIKLKSERREKHAMSAQRLHLSAKDKYMR